MWVSCPNGRVTLSDTLSPAQVTEDVHRLLHQGLYHFVCRGKVSVKGKGEMLTYFLEGRADSSGSQGLTRLHKPCSYRRAGLRGRLAMGRPPGAPMVRATLGALQGAQHPPLGVVGKDA